MRRAHPIVFVAMWAVVTLLAVAGFAAFQITGRSVPAPAADELGREIGAVVGLGFTNASAGSTAVAAVARPSQPSTTTPVENPSTSQAASPDTIPSDGWLSEMQVRALVTEYFQAEDVNRAIRVIWCESRFDPEATNPQNGATGLFQHLPEFWPQRAEAAGFAGAEPTQPEANVAAAAHAIYSEGGWDVFVCIP
jgi:hypothetical protein